MQPLSEKTVITKLHSTMQIITIIVNRREICVIIICPLKHYIYAERGCLLMTVTYMTRAESGCILMTVTYVTRAERGCMLMTVTYVTRAESGCMLMTVGLGLYVNSSSSVSFLLLLYRLNGRMVESLPGETMDWNMYGNRLSVL